MKTQKYLAKSNPLQPGVHNKESASFLDCYKNHTRAFVDYLLPMSTQLYDLRIKGTNLAEWNEEFIINEFAYNMYHQDILFLFEILDFDPRMIFDKQQKSRLNAELLYPVAWAYLRPLGTACIHMSRTRLQLYRYKFKYDHDVKSRRPFDDRTPAVLLEFNWDKKEMYPSFLEIDVAFTNKCE